MDVFLKILLGCLVFFAPFSFAATEPWAFSVLQGGLSSIICILLATRSHFFISPVFKSVLLLVGTLIVLALLQAVFPHTILDKVPWYPSTLIRLYTLEHASVFATYLALVWGVMQLYPSFTTVRRGMLLLTACGSCVAITALLFPNGEYLTFLTGIKRIAIGPFLNRNHAALFLAMSTICSIGLWFTWQISRPHHLNTNQKGAFYVRQIALGLIISMLLVATVLTRSRGGLLSLLAGLFCFSFLSFWAIPFHRATRIKGLLCTFILLVGTCACLYTYWPQINAFAQRTGGESEEIRQVMYHAAGTMLKESPVWGIGIGAMPVAIPLYVEQPIPAYIERLHCDWLEILLGIGIAGAVPLLFGLGWFGWLTLRRLRKLERKKQFAFAALLSTLLTMGAGSSVDFHFFIPANAFLFFVCTGFICAPTFFKGHIHSWYAGRFEKLPLVLFCLAALYIPTQHTLAWRGFMFGKGLKKQGKLATYEQALMHYPSPRYALRLANAYLNTSKHETDPAQKTQLRRNAHQIARNYLEKYPKEKELSKLYMRSKPR